MKTKFILIFAFNFLLFSAKANPFYPKPIEQGIKKYGFSYGLSGVISFFSVDKRISEKAIPRAGFGGGFRMEFYPSQNVHFQFGLEVLSQACAFNTYYFAPGHSVYYDGSYGYTHTLRTAELYLPITVRIGFQHAEGNLQTIFYGIGGYAPKLFLGANNNIVENSTGKFAGGGSTELTFENYLFSPTLGSVMMGGFGCDKRIGFTEKFITFQAIFRYNFSRFKYSIGKNTDDYMMIKNYCINLQVGYRF